MTLPTPDPAFHWTAEPWGDALRCKPLTAVAKHAFTTKQLPLRGGPEQQPTAWTQATASVGGGLDQLIRVKQVHGASVRVLKKGAIGPRDVSDKPEGDAIVANAPGLILSVQIADCVPILLADPQSGAAAAIHAGWRGTSAAVARRAVEVMEREMGARASDLIAAIGPSIGPCCYTVGHNVFESFRDAGASVADMGAWFSNADDGTLRLDLWTANHNQLIAAGMKADRVHVCRLCTQTHRQVFESYRVDGEAAGRLTALIMVP